MKKNTKTQTEIRNLWTAEAKKQERIDKANFAFFTLVILTVTISIVGNLVNYLVS